MKRPDHTYKHGEPVWAHMEGFPWWPGRVVNIDEVVVDSGEPELIVRDDEVLVEFFNDNKRFAAMPFRRLRRFLDKRFGNINRNYSGNYINDLREAVVEADDYAHDHGWVGEDAKTATKPSASASAAPTGRASKPSAKARARDDYPDDADDDVDDHRPPKRVKKRRKKPSNDADLDPHEKPRKRKKKRSERESSPVPEKSSKRDASPEDDQSAKRETSPPVDKRPKSESPVAKERRSKREDSPVIDRRPKSEDSPGIDRRAKRESSLAQDARDDDRRKRKRRRRHDDHPNDPLDMAEPLPEAPVPRKNKKRKEAHSDSREKERVDAEMDRAPAEVKLEQKEEQKAADRRKDTDVPSGEEVLVPKYKRDDLKERKAADLSKDENVDGEQGTVPVREGEAYRSLSKEQLISLVVAREEEVRSYRIQLWRYRLENMEALEDGEIIRTLEALQKECGPVFDLVTDFLSLCESEFGSSNKSEKRKKMERKTVDAVWDLQKIQFDISLMKDGKMAGRALKLARKAKHHSLEVSRVMRDLMCQWVDILDIENVSEEGPSPGPKKEAPSTLESEAPDEDEKIVATAFVARVVQKAAVSSDTVARSPNEDKSEAKDSEKPGPKPSETKSEESKNANTPTKDVATPASESAHVDKSPEKKSTEKTDSGNDTTQNRKSRVKEARVKAFTRELCQKALASILAFPEESGIEKIDDKKKKELAKALECAIFPRREDDPRGYYISSRNVTSCIKALLKPPTASPAGDDTSKYRSTAKAALIACVSNSEEVEGFVRKCLDGAFASEKS